jgi:multicomponent Na+:H+ antiporter subunit D
MAVYGVVFAGLENDIRRLLAYHIISQVGYMVAGVGIGTAVAINGATAHAFAHILYKALLFMGAGTVLYTTGRSKLTELGGLARLMPLTLVLYMVGAFSISGFPLFSGFVSKSMVIHAAELNHMGVVVLLLNLASVGTFLHTGLKLPYFTWFGPNRSLKPAPTPRNMYVGMSLTAAVCLAIGVYPALLYNLLPYAVDYQPYTATHVLETMQLLVFTGFGFWLLIKKLGGEATITLDTDWFYRRPSRLAYNWCVVPLSRLFATVESFVLYLTGCLVKISANPVGCLIGSARLARCVFFGGELPRHEPLTFDPGRYRLSIGIMVLVVLACFVILIVWSFATS